MPNTGVAENGVVRIHSGFSPVGSGGILDSSMFGNADFRQSGYQIAQLTVEEVPEPAAFAVAGVALLLLAAVRRRTQA